MRYSALTIAFLLSACGGGNSVMFDGDQLDGQARIEAPEEPAFDSGAHWMGLNPDDPELATLRTQLQTVVVHATGTETVEQALIALQEAGKTTHFIIDADGAILQAMDLSWAAHHTDGFDLESVAIHLVNPLPDLAGDERLASACASAFSGDADWTPTDGHGQRCAAWAEAGWALSESAQINGALRQSLAFSPAQHNALILLLRDLNLHVPGLAADIPVTVDGSVVTTVLVLDPGQGGAPFRGVVAAWHLDATTWSPGPGLDWALVRGGLLAPRE